MCQEVTNLKPKLRTRRRRGDLEGRQKNSCARRLLLFFCVNLNCHSSIWRGLANFMALAYLLSSSFIYSIDFRTSRDHASFVLHSWWALNSRKHLEGQLQTNTFHTLIVICANWRAQMYQGRYPCQYALVWCQFWDSQWSVCSAWKVYLAPTLWMSLNRWPYVYMYFFFMEHFLIKCNDWFYIDRTRSRVNSRCR